jgi:hypothetical protein
MMQLLDNINRFGKKQRVKHYITLLADSYRKERKSVEVCVLFSPVNYPPLREDFFMQNLLSIDAFIKLLKVDEGLQVLT